MTKWMKAKIASVTMLAVLAIAMVVPALAGATADPALTDAKTQATSYFSSNLAVVVGGFIAVAGALWLLSMLFNSIGVRRKRSI
jgi:uncharacterized oligopeptide transporter (OPT) family protein